MRYRVTIDGREREVDVQLGASGAIAASLDGEPVDAAIVPVPGGVLVRMNVGGAVFDVAVGGRGDELTVAAGRHRAIVQVESERARATKRRGARAGGAMKELRSPMPGRIVKVLVVAGEDVQAGQPVIVVEAMKMENELRATAAAKVASVEVKPGDAVEGGAVLVRFG